MELSFWERWNSLEILLSLNIKETSFAFLGVIGSNPTPAPKRIYRLESSRNCKIEINKLDDNKINVNTSYVLI